MSRNIPFVLLVLVACFPQTVVGQASFEGLGDLPSGAFSNRARDVSNDGTIVVGNSRSEFGVEAFRWTASGMVRLTEPNGEWKESKAFDVSADGSIIVGWSKSRSTSGEQAVVWDVVNGMRLVKDVLEHDLCLDLTGWNYLSRASAISDDGLMIVGTGVIEGSSPKRTRPHESQYPASGWPPLFQRITDSCGAGYVLGNPAPHTRVRPWRRIGSP